MIIRKISANFTPLHQGILFDIESGNELPSDMVVEIVDVKSEEVVATQLLRNTISARVNIAPYLTRFEEYAPTLCNATSFSKAPTAIYKVRVGEIESDDIIISVNRTPIATTPAIVTSLPPMRRISYGENDEVLIVTDNGKKIYAEMENNNGEIVHLEYLPTTDATLLTITPSTFNTESKSFEVILYCEGQILGKLRYAVTSSQQNSSRLAWLSESGAIERYTFPRSYKTLFATDKRRIMTAEGICSAFCRTKQIVALSSRIEPCATIKALAQIASSPKVWLEQNGRYELVDITTSQIEHNMFGEASYLYLEATISQKEVSL